jgi:MSHA pilin protein MshC
MFRLPALSTATRDHGFTVIELVVVIVILGILAAFAAPRFFDNRTFAERGYYEELASALKYAQKLAVASGCSVRMQITAGAYDARQQAVVNGSCDTADATWPTVVRLSNGQLLSGTSPVGVSASPAVTLTFDSLGRVNLASDQSISVGSFALTVKADSGYVQAP